MDTREEQPESHAAEGRLQLEVKVGQTAFSASGDGELVLRAFGDFQEHLRQLPDQLAASPAEEPERVTETETPAAPAPRTEPEKPTTETHDDQLPVFLKRRPNLKTNAQIAAGIAVWGNRYRNQEEFTSDDMETFWRGSGHRVPSNVPRDMGTAAKEGWLQRVSSGKYAPTAYGERFVDEQVKEED